MSSARSMPGMLGDVRADYFWPALVLLVLDLDISAEMLVPLPVESLDANTGRLRCRLLVYELHPRTLEALQALSTPRRLLLPWPKDGGRGPFHMLYRDFKTVLYRAGLPFTRCSLFERLRVTSRRCPRILDLIGPVLDFVPMVGKPHISRARDRRRVLLPCNIRKTEPMFQGNECPARSGRKRWPALPAIAVTQRPETLHVFFLERYKPNRLRQAKAKTAQMYERSVRELYAFAGRELAFDDLSDELIENFLTDCYSRGLRPATCNRKRCELLALWRYGWKKRLTAELPRDVPKLDVTELLPDAWTTEELEQIIRSAASVPGDTCGIPSRLWWPAFLLTLYDTGLRVNALLQRECADLNCSTGWLSIPASDQKHKKAQALKLHSDSLELIRMTHPEDRQWLFPWPFSCRRLIRRHYREILQSAGLPATSRDLFHKLRRTCATALARVTDEATAQKHLGHSSVIITRRYLDLRQFQSIAAADLMNRPRVSVSHSEGGATDN